MCLANLVVVDNPARVLFIPALVALMVFDDLVDGEVS
jgi:hypothetical protein